MDKFYIFLTICGFAAAGFITTNKHCATLKLRLCLNNELAGAGRNNCESTGGVLADYPIYHMEYIRNSSPRSSINTESSSTLLNLVSKLESAETNKTCRLTICDDKNLMGLNCHQFAPNRSYSFSNGSYPHEVKSYLCVCEDGEWENEKRTKLWKTIKNGGDSEFDRNYMGVRFSPDYYGTEYYYLKEVRQILLTVVTRFISVYKYANSNDEIYGLMLTAAGEINARFGYLMLRVSILPTKGWLDIAVKAVRQANRKFPGTVWGISANEFDLSCSNPVQCLHYLRNETREILNDDELYHQLKFGYHPPTDLASGLERHLHNISKLADYVVNYERAILEDLSNGEFQNAVQNFSKLVAEVNPKMKVFTNTGTESVEYGLKGLVKFWHELNKFGINNQSYFLMTEALDQPNRLDYTRYMGWWTRDGVTGELVEKAEMENQNGENPRPITESGTDWLTILLVTIFVFIIIFGVASIFVWRRFRNARNRRDDIKQMVLEFKEGSFEFTTIDDARNYVVAIRAPYDPKHELLEEEIVTDPSSVKTSRDDVTVAKGTISKDNFNGAIILKSTSAATSIRSIRHLLTEIKIYNYLGPHENVVRFIGAITSKIDKGIVQLALEFCPIGDLLSFLTTKVNANCLEEMLNENKFDGENCDELQVVTSYVSVDAARELGYAPLESAMTSPPDCDNLCRSSSQSCGSNENNEKVAIDLQQMYGWCMQIANAMDFLNTKDIVLADLAARNCLMFDIDHIKISDFGLSKRQYVELGQGQVNHEDGTQLPVRWMPPESMKRLAFTSKSDVWSFGVTVWEIFSLGQVPFPDIPFDQDFIEQLESGSLRLPKPKFASDEIYDKLLDCWNTFPDDRPYFKDLKSFFMDLLPVDETEIQVSNSERDSDSVNISVDSTPL